MKTNVLSVFNKQILFCDSSTPFKSVVEFFIVAAEISKVSFCCLFCCCRIILFIKFLYSSFLHNQKIDTIVIQGSFRYIHFYSPTFKARIVLVDIQHKSRASYFCGARPSLSPLDELWCGVKRTQQLDPHMYADFCSGSSNRLNCDQISKKHSLTRAESFTHGNVTN